MRGSLTRTAVEEDGIIVSWGHTLPPLSPRSPILGTSSRSLGFDPSLPRYCLIDRLVDLVVERKLIPEVSIRGHRTDSCQFVMFFREERVKNQPGDSEQMPYDRQIKRVYIITVCSYFASFVFSIVGILAASLGVLRGRIGANKVLNRQ